MGKRPPQEPIDLDLGSTFWRNLLSRSARGGACHNAQVETSLARANLSLGCKVEISDRLLWTFGNSMFRLDPPSA